MQGGIQGGELLPQVVWDDFLGHPVASELLEGFETLQWSPGRLGSAESRRASGLRGFAAGVVKMMVGDGRCIHWNHWMWI